MISWLMRYNLPIFHLSLCKILSIPCLITSSLSNYKMRDNFQWLLRKVESILGNGLFLINLAFSKDSIIVWSDLRTWLSRQRSSISPRIVVWRDHQLWIRWSLLMNIGIILKRLLKILFFSNLFSTKNQFQNKEIQHLNMPIICNTEMEEE